jgi:ankyrin repeat protein
MATRGEGKQRVKGRATDDERCADYARFECIDEAIKAGDIEALRRAVEDPERILDAPLHPAIGLCLEYAIYHAPLAFIREVLELGADPNPADHDGFPPLIAALSCSRSHPGATARPDVQEILELLLRAGADPNQRGLNDYTPLHMAVAEGNAGAVRLLLTHGADPALRTRIDDLETPREIAEALGHVELAAVLAAAEAER